MAAEAATTTTELIAGKYQLVRQIARGGMGTVWEGVHVSLGTRVAVKLIDPNLVDSEEAMARFQAEAKASALIVSKYVVRVFDHGETADGHPYIVMEYLEGEALDARVARLGRMSVEETARIIGQVARGLARAHEAGIVHRDLKPENVVITLGEDGDEEVAKILDFGIAKLAPTVNVPVPSMTTEGALLGTPSYMSPEQVRGLKSLDHRSDLWTLGVITYQCLVGRAPFNGEVIGDLFVKICADPLPVPSEAAPDLPPAFDAWFAKALGREPEERFQSAVEMAAALREALGIVGDDGRTSMVGLAPVSGRISFSAVRESTVVPDADPSIPIDLDALSESIRPPGMPPRRRKVLLVVGAAVGLAIGFAVAMSGGGESPSPAAASASAAAPSAAPAATTSAAPTAKPAATTVATGTATAPTTTGKPAATAKPSATTTANPRPRKRELGY